MSIVNKTILVNHNNYYANYHSSVLYVDVILHVIVLLINLHFFLKKLLIDLHLCTFLLYSVKIHVIFLNIFFLLLDLQIYLQMKIVALKRKIVV